MKAEKIAIALAALGVAAAVTAAPPSLPGGGSPGGGFQGGGMMPGGQGGSFVYDGFISVTTNSDATLVREGVLYGYTPSLSACVKGSSAVSRLAHGVFACNTTITSVDLSATAIAEIPDSAFAYCTSLTNVVLPATCKTIAGNAFEGCTKLEASVDGVDDTGDDGTGSDTDEDADDAGGGASDGGETGGGTDATASSLDLSGLFADAEPVTGLSSVYNGYLLQDGAIAGSVQLRLGKRNSRTGVSRVSARVQALGSKKVAFSGSCEVDLQSTAKATLSKTIQGLAHTLELDISAESFTGSFDGLAIAGARNVSAARESRSGEYASWAGTWTVAFETTAASGDGAALAAGFSALSIKIASKGKARVVGTMADGTTVSVSSQQLLLAPGGDYAYLPVVIPLYKDKLGGLGFMLVLGSDGSAQVAGVSPWDASTSTGGAFTAELDPVGVAGIASPSAGTLTFTLDADDFPATILSREVVASMLPCETAVAVSAAARLTALDSTASLRLSYKSSTGLFSGSFSAFVKNGTRISKKTVNVRGVFVDGTGYASAFVKKAFSAPAVLK